MKINQYKILFFIAIYYGLLFESPTIFSEILKAKSTSFENVRSTVSAAISGDTVIIPAGESTWETPITISKGIKLVGSGIGKTIITGSSSCLSLNILESENFVINGIEFIVNNNTVIKTSGNCHAFRITNCKFYTEIGTALLEIGSVNDSDLQYGLIDNCYFVNGRILIIPGQGDKSWKEDTDLGTEKAVYVEDCSFTQPNGYSGNAIDANHGGRYVFRHNKVVDKYIMSHSLQNGASEEFARGTRKVEIYENQWTQQSTASIHYGAIGLGAGTGVVFNNSVTNTPGHPDPYNLVVALDNLRTYGNGSGRLTIADGGNIIDGNTAVTDGTGAYTGINNSLVLTCSEKNWVINEYIAHRYYIYNLTDGSKGLITANTATTVTATLLGGRFNYWKPGDVFKISNGYPCLDQIGRGKDSGPIAVIHPRYDGTDRLPQVLEPMYIWNNKLDGVVIDAVVTNDCVRHIQENRDYYNLPKPGYIPYSFPHPLRWPLNLTTPNGKEAWPIGSTQIISWTTCDYQGMVELSLYRDGVRILDIGTVQADDCKLNWTLPTTLATGGGYKIKIVGGVNTDQSENSFSIIIAPVIALSRTSLNFGAAAGVKTSSQNVLIKNVGNGTLSWSSVSNRSWLKVSPESGIGNGWLTVSVDPTGLEIGSYSGQISVSDIVSLGSAKSITVTLRVTTAGLFPFGSFDSPSDNTFGITGCLPIMGWALDDIEIAGVKIFRNPYPGEPVQPNGLVYLGESTMVDGARPDVEIAYPAAPFNSKGGWGYLLLTNLLPNKGNGTYTITAIANDREGHSVPLGSRNIICDNAHATKPFGTIDTPIPGGIVKGNSLLNFGWALTPLPGIIPLDGSTIVVFVDGVYLGHPAFNFYRQDIAEIFPGLLNSLGASGNFVVDTSGLSDGLHTIAWGVTDNRGNASGIGSRYFLVQRDSGTAFQGEVQNIISLLRESDRIQAGIMNMTSPLLIRRGFSQSVEWIYPDQKGEYRVDFNTGEPVLLELNPNSEDVAKSSLSYSGVQYVGEDIRRLPVGSHFDPGKGRFSWLPGAGFAGTFRFDFSLAADRSTILNWRIIARLNRSIPRNLRESILSPNKEILRLVSDTSSNR